MRNRKAYLIFSLMFFTLASYAAEEEIKLDTTYIKANKELPQILYVVPWKDIRQTGEPKQKLVLHDFFGDLYNPVTPQQLDQLEAATPTNQQVQISK